MNWHRGDRVHHAKWGPGTVLAVRVLGRVRVRFDGERLPITVEEEDLVPEGGPRPDPKQPPSRSDSGGATSNGRVHPPEPSGAAGPTPGPSRRRPAVHTPIPALPSAAPATLRRPEAWQTLEALRLGVVPARGVRQYTVAREEELHGFEQLLGRGRGCRVLWGDYGSGKTHMLEATEQLALERGFAVARITLDPKEQALHHPVRLYHSIMASVRTIEQATPGFEAILEPLADNASHRDPNGEHASRFFSPYLHALHSGNLDAIGWLRDYIAGDNIASDEVNRVLSRLGWRGQNVLRMSDFRTYGRMYIHLIGTLACWIADAGHRGLVLLFDEVERVDTLSASNQDYAFEVLRHYAAVTMEDRDLAFDPERLYRGGHAVHQRIPLRFRADQPLTTVFALTPLAEIEGAFATLTESEAYDVPLAPLARASLPALVERIGALYETAYPGFSVTAPMLADIVRELEGAIDDGHDRFRDAVRASVFLLDGARWQGTDRRPA